ncbi:MAG: hypothetical protein ACRDG5_00185 [Anaerolineales bacterium]
MEEALLFLREIRGWVYALLGLAGLVYLRQAWRAFHEYRHAFFGLERERAGARLSRAGAMLALLVAGAGATFVLVEFFSPAVPASERPTPVSTVFLLATPATGTPPVEGEFVTATPLPAAQIDSTGCLNPKATLTEPAPDAELRGEVVIRGTADIENFAFYRFEYISLVPGSTWRAIVAGTKPVVDIDGELGSWGTRLVTPGEYAFRLVVTDTSGNAPMPCVIRVRILPGE